jgi:hypothetical protein
LSLSAFIFIRIYLCASVDSIRSLVVESITQLYENFAGVIPMETAEGQTVIEHHAEIPNIQGVGGNGKVLSEVFTNGKINCRVRGQIVLCGATRSDSCHGRAVSVAET